ncbi:MAG: hypothetical protein ACLR5G_18015 [Eubacteriales bacterium]
MVHAVCCVFVNLYGDDYYYAGFTRNGLGYFVSENIFHYKYTNGRALVHLLDELLLSNFWFWRIFNVAALGLLILTRRSRRQCGENPISFPCGSPRGR